MTIAIERAQRAQHDVLSQLMQFYVYDFSELMGLEVEEDGRFAERGLAAYWDDPRRLAFLVRSGGRLAGFALVHRGSRLSGDLDVWDMAEFFVLRRHRRAGVGTQAAHQLFAIHRGHWEVRQRPENTAATTFWRRSIRDYTSGAFTELAVDDARWRGPVQQFTS